MLHTARTHVLSLWQLLFQSDHNARYSVNSNTIGINYSVLTVLTVYCLFVVLVETLPTDGPPPSQDGT